MTNSPTTFGLLTGATTASDIQALEALPFETLWVGGHIASRNPSPEALMQLARLAALTTHVRIGTAALLLPLYPAAIVAKQVADLDRVSGGRVILGVGVGGEYPQEFEACGVPIGERGARTDEAIPLLRLLWSGDEVSHQGRFHAMNKVRIHPPPAQRGGPPILVAGRSPAAMQRAARLGDGWMPYLYSPERYEKSVHEVRSHADAAGRSLDEHKNTSESANANANQFSWTAFVFVNIEDRAEDAIAGAAAFLGGNFKQDVGPLLDRVAAVGTPEQVAERLRAFVDAGARHLIIAPATNRDPLLLAQRVAAEVRPVVDPAAPHHEH
ncbi:MAG: LLM class flavin-dependent oxidoreductase [Acidimicrobiales bacterium]